MKDFSLQRLGGRTPRPHRHAWAQTLVGTELTPPRCTLCGKVDDGSTRRNRNNRARGSRAELEVAKLLGGEKVGPLGLPEDVRIEGYARLQVKKLARLPSLSAVSTWLNAMPAGQTMRGVVIVEAGRNGRRFIVFDLDEFASQHGR